MTAHLRIYKPANLVQQGVLDLMDFLEKLVSASSEQSEI
jgi:hypothetical protein